MNPKPNSYHLRAILATLALAITLPSAAIAEVHVDPGSGTDEQYAPPLDTVRNQTKVTEPAPSEPQSYDNSYSQSTPTPAPLPTVAKPDTRAADRKRAVVTAQQIADDYSGWLIDRFGNRVRNG
jgi:hypothetical protein